MSGVWRAAASALAGMAALGAATGALLTARVLRAQRVAAEVAPAPADAVMVFGATAWPEGPSFELRDRLDHALGLWARAPEQPIVVSGGFDGEIDEVQTMRDYLIAQGVPDSLVVPGRPGTNTRTTIRTLARLGPEMGVGSWIAVTTPFHARRVLDEARRRNVRVAVSGPSSSPEMRLARRRRVRVATEVVATVFYALPESVSTRINTAAGTWRHSIPLRLAPPKR